MTSQLDILCLGEPLVEFNETGPRRWLEGFGGDVSNVAIAARRLGARSGIATRLGADGFGDQLMALWAAEGVDAGAVTRDTEAPTGLYFVRHGEDGHSFEYRRAGSAASLMSPGNLPREAIRGARCLHLSGITQAISDSAAEAGLAAIEVAREAGVAVSYDPNLRLRLWPLERAREVIHASMRLADVALPGLEDARLLTGLQDPGDIARFYLDLGCRVVALTLGPDGALVATHDGVEQVPPRPARLVDATGAGDCFDGAFLTRWLATGDAVAAARYAVVAASLSVEGYGAVAPLPTAEDVEGIIAGGRAAPASPAPAAASLARKAIALVAHDAKKDEMVEWVRRHRRELKEVPLFATGTTGARVMEAVPELDVTRLKSGPLGGDQQVGALIAEGALEAVIFFIDPLSALPHDVDVKALTRLATVYDLPFACSPSTATLIIERLSPIEDRTENLDR
ncbi:2-dehydro-3-deoxygluconate kinase [Lutibaculum baratangense AMV1]|uniref:Methylglyoxal synthase n=1 Tax=Lutibaculum baratangense AMV1 TaxID=631454 RepID=V4QWL7_9HYPH|nr:2-dehydro-3-deoxygluconate kinase [Lutibaculum baratangense AMV1]